MTTEPDTIARPPVPISVGLLGRHSLLGGAVVLGVALLYILLVPALNSSIEGENPFKVGQPYVIFDAYQITPQEGWEVDASDLFVSLSKGSASLLFTGVVPADETPEASIQTVIDGLEADTSGTWVIGEPTTFVTDAGDHGATVSAHTSENASETWAVTNGTSNVTVIGSSPNSVWSSEGAEMEAMVKSIVFLETESGQ